MTPSFPPASRGGADQSNYGPAAMAGDSGMSPSPAPGPDSGMGAGAGGDEGMQQVIMEVRSMDQRVNDLTAQFPSAAAAARQASAGLKAMLRSIVANPGGPEPEAPEGAE